MKPKIIIILGQTATGKSDLAVRLAKKINGLNRSKRSVGRTSQNEVLGEIISADSRQVYKGLDIGTGKITKKEMRGVLHHLLDVVNPKKRFNAALYKKLAGGKIKEIVVRGKVPIIVGGTGFYIDTLVNGTILPEVPPNKILRKKLESENIIELFKILQKLDPQRARGIDRNNKVRLVRAIEIARALGKVPTGKVQPCQYNILKIGVKVAPEKLKENIKKRLLKRINPSVGGGMIKEAQKLHEQGLSWKRMNELGLEYKYLALYLQKKIPKNQMITELNTAINQYAKRQWTWFKRDKSISWFDPASKSFIKETNNLIKDFL